MGDYTPCEKTGDALIVEVSGAPCDAARAVAAVLTDVPAADVEAVLRAQGWAPVRTTATRFEESYELFAVRGRAGLWIRRRGDAPDIDSWTAGRELLFSRAALVALAQPSEATSVCTSEPVVDRGILAAPLFVRGRALPKLGRLVCFSGRASGVDRCGRIIRSYPGTGGLPCLRTVAEQCFTPLGPVLAALNATLVTATGAS